MYSAYKKNIIDTSVSLDSPARGSGHLPIGAHQLEITRVTFDARDRIIIKFEDVSGTAHVEKLFILNSEETKWATDFKRLMSTLLSDIRCQAKLLSISNSVLARALIGLKLNVVIGYSNGYLAKSLGNRFVATDAKTGERIGNKDYKSLTELQSVMLKQGIRKSLTTITEPSGFKYQEHNIGRFLDVIHTIETAEVPTKGTETISD